MAAVNYTRPAILQALHAGDMTAAELAEELDVRLKTAEYNLRKLREEGLVHIRSWRKPVRQGKRAAVYRLGAGRNTPMTRRTLSQKRADQNKWARRYRLRKQLAASKGNPFGALIAQIAPVINLGRFGAREAA